MDLGETSFSPHTLETVCVLYGSSQDNSKGTFMCSLSLGVLSFDISSPYTSETKPVSQPDVCSRDKAVPITW